MAEPPVLPVDRIHELLTNPACGYGLVCVPSKLFADNQVLPVHEIGDDGHAMISVALPFGTYERFGHPTDLERLPIKGYDYPFVQLVISSQENLHNPNLYLRIKAVNREVISIHRQPFVHHINGDPAPGRAERMVQMDDQEPQTWYMFPSFFRLPQLLPLARKDLGGRVPVIVPTGTMAGFDVQLPELMSDHVHAVYNGNQYQQPDQTEVVEMSVNIHGRPVLTFQDFDGTIRIIDYKRTELEEHLDMAQATGDNI